MLINQSFQIFVKILLKINMKKLLLLLISLFLSFNSYGEWTKLFTDEDGTTWHINIETIKERDGSVFLWQMNSSKEGSSTMLSENDCDLVRTKFIQMYDYDEPMLEGYSTLVPMDGTEWMFLPPETVGEFILQFACELAPQSQEKRLETVFELTKFVEEEEENVFLLDKKKYVPVGEEVSSCSGGTFAGTVINVN